MEVTLKFVDILLFMLKIKKQAIRNYICFCDYHESNSVTIFGEQTVKFCVDI